MYKSFNATNSYGVRDHAIRNVTLDGDKLTIELFKGRKFIENYYTIIGEWSKNTENKYFFTLKSTGDSIYLFDSDFAGFDAYQKQELINFILSMPHMSRSAEDIRYEKMEKLNKDTGGLIDDAFSFASCLFGIIEWGVGILVVYLILSAVLD